MLAKVWNDNVHPHKEVFKEKTIEIPPKGFVTMEWEDAVDFRGKYTPIALDGGGAPLSTSFKMIRLERISDEVAKPTGMKCQACNEEHPDLKTLHQHIKDRHLADLVDEDGVNELTGKKPAAKPK